MSGLYPGPLLIVPAAVAVACAALLVYALRGRRVDNHPICRRCGFDLFGRPEGATQCSECGADVGRPRAIREGRREKRRGLLAVSLPVLLACGGWLGAVGWGTARGVKWDRHKPVWLLSREAQAGRSDVRDAALAELRRRVEGGGLSNQQMLSLAERALARQADPNKTWSPGWGLLIEAVHDQGKLGPENWRRYVRQGFPQHSFVGPPTPWGASWPLKIGATRLGARGRLYFSVQQEPEPQNASGDATLLALRRRGWPSKVVGFEASSWGPYTFDGQIRISSPSGPPAVSEVMTLRVLVDVYDTAQSTVARPGAGSAALPPVRVEMSATWTVLRSQPGNRAGVGG